MRNVSRRRRAQAIVGIAAVAGLLGAGPATSAVGHHATQPTGAQPQLASSRTSVVPGNVRLMLVNHSLLGVHLWYRQMLSGHPVVGGLYARHVETTGPAKGHVEIWDGRVPTGPLVSAKVSVSMATAISTAAAYTQGTPVTLVRPGLMVLPGVHAHLVWKVTTITSRNGVGASYVTYVDSGSGKVLRSVIESRSDSKTKYVNGKASVFDANPVVKLQDEDLTDQNDSNAAVPKKGYSMRVLGHLDSKAHALTGKWARVVNTGNVAHSQNNVYKYKRADDKFEQVMGYYALDSMQSYFHSLGFKDVNAEAQKISTDSIPDDNSFYSPSQDLITTGTGGVDDAEDPEVVWHEDGHATQDAQVPHFGSSEQAGAIGEGFGDYMGVTMGQIYGKDTKLTPTSCVMDWDSTSYTQGPKHCLRTTVEPKMYPEDLDGEVHDDGEIWSHALWDINVALGRDKATTIIIESQFNYAPNTTMPAAAQKTVDAAKKLYGKSVAAKTKQAFKDRGIL